MNDMRYMSLKKRDYSMLYAVIVGFLLFAGGFAALNYIRDFGGSWYNSRDFDRYFSFLEGTEYKHTDSHGGFLGDGVTMIVAQIPEEASPEFIQLLWEKGFTDTPVPEDIQYQLRIDPETCMAADISHSLWWFEDESPADCLGEYTNYTFHAYDLDNGIYYYIEFDS